MLSPLRRCSSTGMPNPRMKYRWVKYWKSRPASASPPRISGTLKQRKVHLLIFNPLVGKYPDHSQQGRIDEEDEDAPPHHGQQPALPGDEGKHLPPAHIDATLQPTVQSADQVGVFGKERIGHEGGQKLAQITCSSGKPRRRRDVDNKGPHQSGVGNPGGHRDHGPDQQEFMEMEAPFLFPKGKERVDHHQQQTAGSQMKPVENGRRQEGCSAV